MMKVALLGLFLLVAVTLARDNSESEDIEKRFLIHDITDFFHNAFKKLNDAFKKLGTKLDLKKVAEKLHTKLTKGQGQIECIAICEGVAVELLKFPKKAIKPGCPIACKAALAIKKKS